MLAPQLSTNWAEYSLDEIVSEFFRQHRSVAFVVTIALKHDLSRSVGRGHYHPYVRVGVNSQWQGLNAPLTSIMKEVMRYVPTVETSAENALNRAKAWPGHAAHFGAYQLGGDKYMRLSAITVLKLLAGKIDYTTFAKAYGFEDRMRNPFTIALTEGRTLEQCLIEKSSNEDDDWIKFEFSEPDPAISQFSIPSRKTDKKL